MIDFVAPDSVRIRKEFSPQLKKLAGRKGSLTAADILKLEEGWLIPRTKLKTFAATVGIDPQELSTRLSAENLPVPLDQLQRLVFDSSSQGLYERNLAIGWTRLLLTSPLGTLDAGTLSPWADYDAALRSCCDIHLGARPLHNCLDATTVLHDYVIPLLEHGYQCRLIFDPLILVRLLIEIGNTLRDSLHVKTAEKMYLRGVAILDSIRSDDQSEYWRLRSRIHFHLALTYIGLKRARKVDNYLKRTAEESARFSWLSMKENLDEGFVRSELLKQKPDFSKIEERLASYLDGDDVTRWMSFESGVFHIEATARQGHVDRAIEIAKDFFHKLKAQTKSKARTFPTMVGFSPTIITYWKTLDPAAALIRRPGELKTYHRLSHKALELIDHIDDYRGKNADKYFDMGGIQYVHGAGAQYGVLHFILAQDLRKSANAEFRLSATFKDPVYVEAFYAGKVFPACLYSYADTLKVLSLVEIGCVVDELDQTYRTSGGEKKRFNAFEPLKRAAQWLFISCFLREVNLDDVHARHLLTDDPERLTLRTLEGRIRPPLSHLKYAFGPAWMAGALGRKIRGRSERKLNRRNRSLCWIRESNDPTRSSLLEGNFREKARTLKALGRNHGEIELDNTW